MVNIDLDAPSNAVAAQKTTGTNLLNSQNAQNQDFLGRYRSLLGGQETTAQAAGRLGEAQGLPTLQNNATMLRNTLTNLPSTYSAATRGFDVNNNQLQRIIGQKSSELAPAVTTAENSLNNAQNTVNTQLGYQQADENRALLPYQSEQALLGQSQQNQLSVFNSENQNELQALMSKLNSGVQLNNGELDRANQLAIAKEQADNQRQIASMQQQYQPLGYGGIYNTANGQTIDTSKLTNLGKYGTYDPTTGQLIGGGGGGTGGTTGSTAPYLSNNSMNLSQYIY